MTIFFNSFIPTFGGMGYGHNNHSLPSQVCNSTSTTILTITLYIFYIHKWVKKRGLLSCVLPSSYLCESGFAWISISFVFAFTRFSKKIKTRHNSCDIIHFSLCFVTGFVVFFCALLLLPTAINVFIISLFLFVVYLRLQYNFCCRVKKCYNCSMMFINHCF